MVKYNKDGDMFFTCSNDYLIIAWDTVNAEKRSVYKGTSACKSLVVSKDTQYVLGSFGLEGVTIFEAPTGEKVLDFKSNAGYKHQYLEFSYGDDELLVLSTQKDDTCVDIYDFKKLLKGNTKPKRSFEFNVELTQVSYGYLNKQLYLSTTKGKMLIINAETGEDELEAKVHPGHHIFSFAFSKDFSMLASCAKDNK
jgi:translation initiation factor 3 subunit I